MRRWHVGVMSAQQRLGKGRGRTRTFLSTGRSTLSFPKRTWKGEHANSTSPDSVGRSTTITSMAPVSVAGLMDE